MSVVTAHMGYFCGFARSEIIQKNARELGPVILYCLGGTEDLGEITWFSEELRGGSAVIDRHKGGIRP